MFDAYLFDPCRTPRGRGKPDGSDIDLGHPLGATGAMLDELERRDLQTGAVTLCVGGGMGIATVIERV
jgi:acetyl-CoA C-acetyltransferase